MIAFIFKRLLSGFLMLLALLFISLWLIRQIPGSYSDRMYADDPSLYQKPEDRIEKIPLFYFNIIPDKKNHQNISAIFPVFIWHGRENEFQKLLSAYFSFEFGKSLVDGMDVSSKIFKALPWSILLQLPAICLLIVLSIGIAFRRVRYPEASLWKGLDTLLVWIHSIPGFWLATMLLLIFANPDFLAWFPTGFQSISSYSPWRTWFQFPQYYVLPILCLVLPALAYLVRLIKNGLNESLQKLFWTRALSSGLSFDQALFKEALPLALIPLIAWTAGIFPAFISGSLIIEYIFSIPGLGRLMYLSISMRDWPVVQFLFLLGSGLTIIGFIVSDVLLHYFDPRIRLK